MIYELFIAVKKGLQAKTYFMGHREGFVKGNHMFGNRNVIKNVLILLLVLMRMYLYSYSAFSNVLVLIHHHCTLENVLDPRSGL